MPDAAARPTTMSHEKYDRLIDVARKHPPMTTAVCHPCDVVSLESAVEAAKLGLMKPILVGPPARVRDAAKNAKLDISTFELIESAHSHDSAAKAVELVRAGRAEALMKGSLHTDELMGAIFTAASLMISASGCRGTSITKQWLMRRPVRMPLSRDTAAPMSSSV